MKREVSPFPDDAEDSYTAAMADMLAGTIFLFIIVAMTFALFSRIVEQRETDKVIVKAEHLAALEDLAAGLRNRGFSAEVVVQHNLVRIMNPPFFRTADVGFKDDAPSRIDAFDEVIIDWVQRFALAITADPNRNITYRGLSIRLHAAGGTAVEPAVLTKYRASALHAELIRRDHRYATLTNDGGDFFFVVAGVGNSLLDPITDDSGLVYTEALDLVTSPVVPWYSVSQ